MLKFLYIHPLTLPIFIFFLLVDPGRTYLKFYLFIFLHELSHMLTAFIFKEKCSRLCLFPWGCMLSVGFLHKKSSFFIFLSGPIFNLFMFFLNIFPYENLALALFNLMPIMPLDGGMLISILFPHFYPFITIAFILFLFVYCFLSRLFPLLPVILTLVFILGEKSKADKTISEKIILHFRQK